MIYSPLQSGICAQSDGGGCSNADGHVDHFVNSTAVNIHGKLTLELKLAILVDNIGFLLDGLDREVGRTDLLCDTTGFTLLDVGLANLVEQLRLAGIDMAENTANGRAEVVGRTCCQGSLMCLFAAISSFPLALRLDIPLLFGFRVIRFAPIVCLLPYGE
jgi:hypothetical protein